MTKLAFRKRLKSFIANAKFSNNIKKINTLLEKNTDAKGTSTFVKNIEIEKNGKKVKLVSKEYFHITDNKMHSKQAKKEFAIFELLKKRGFKVPPTIRLVKRNGKLILVQTDLTKFGDIIQKAHYKKSAHFEKFYNELSQKIGKPQARELIDYISSENRRARKMGLELMDSWEVVINSKTKKATPFIIDVNGTSYVRDAEKFERSIKF